MKNKMIVEGNIYVAGVYTMSTQNKVIYIGSSLECNDALSRHVYNCKRGYYTDSNKKELQLAYDRGDLTFKVIKESASSGQVKNMNNAEKENLQESLSMLEQFYIGVFKDTVCNKQMFVRKHSSNKDKNTTLLRREANLGINNPRAKADEKMIANILFLKECGLKPREIVSLLAKQGIGVKNTYISRIGLDRWIHIKSECPEWYKKTI